MGTRNRLDVYQLSLLVQFARTVVSWCAIPPPDRAAVGLTGNRKGRPAHSVIAHQGKPADVPSTSRVLSGVDR